MVKKERVLVELLRYPLEELSKRELRYIDRELKNLVKEIRDIPLSVKVILRRYGFTEEELKRVILNRETIYKEISVLKKTAKVTSKYYPKSRVREDLKGDKWKIINLINQGYTRNEIFEEVRTFPCINTWDEFRRELIKEGYIKSRSYKAVEMK